MEAVSIKVGLVMLILGAMHFLNLIVFAKWRRRALTQNRMPLPPPIG